jgi:Putative peptidoglycan binding domain
MMPASSFSFDFAKKTRPWSASGLYFLELTTFYMNLKKLVVLTVALGLFAISTANVHAQTHRNSGFASHASTSHSFVGPGTGTFRGGTWNGGWHHHHHDNSVIFIGDFGFPFWGWGYPIGYPYGYGYGGYYSYGYPYPPYYGGGYYGNGYYGGGYYGAGGYASPVYASYGYGSGYGHQSSVARLQRQLARAGYYRGPIDGIMGPRTRYALRAYRHDHGGGAYGMTDR